MKMQLEQPADVREIEGNRHDHVYAMLRFGTDARACSLSQQFLGMVTQHRYDDEQIVGCERH